MSCTLPLTERLPEILTVLNFINMNGKTPLNIHPSFTFHQYDQQAVTVEFSLNQILLIQDGNQIYIEGSLFRKFLTETQRNHGIVINFLKKHKYERIFPDGEGNSQIG